MSRETILINALKEISKGQHAELKGDFCARAKRIASEALQEWEKEKDEPEASNSDLDSVASHSSASGNSIEEWIKQEHDKIEQHRYEIGSDNLNVAPLCAGCFRDGATALYNLLSQRIKEKEDKIGSLHAQINGYSNLLSSQRIQINQHQQQISSLTAQLKERDEEKKTILEAMARGTVLYEKFASLEGIQSPTTDEQWHEKYLRLAAQLKEREQTLSAWAELKEESINELNIKLKEKEEEIAEYSKQVGESIKNTIDLSVKIEALKSENEELRRKL